MLKTALPNNNPWYRHPFVWLLITFPLTAVIAGFYTFYVAVHTNDGLVADDYYEQGKEINQDLHRDQAASARGMEAQIMLGSNRQSLRVLLNQPVTGTLKLKLMHPTRAGFDQSTQLSAQGPNMWVATLPKPLEQSTWQVELSDSTDKWRLYAEWQIQPDQVLTLIPNG